MLAKKAPILRHDVDVTPYDEGNNSQCNKSYTQYGNWMLTYMYANPSNQVAR